LVEKREGLAYAPFFFPDAAVHPGLSDVHGIQYTVYGRKWKITVDALAF
jgi:hypothetical protein